jgi:hypothetical protein
MESVEDRERRRAEQQAEIAQAIGIAKAPNVRLVVREMADHGRKYGRQVVAWWGGHSTKWRAMVDGRLLVECDDPDKLRSAVLFTLAGLGPRETPPAEPRPSPPALAPVPVPARDEYRQPSDPWAALTIAPLPRRVRRTRGNLLRALFSGRSAAAA